MGFLDFEGMTRFEKARIISTRSLQIAMGAPPLIDEEAGMDPIGTARKEFEEGVVPLTVKHKEPPKME